MALYTIVYDQRIYYLVLLAVGGPLVRAHEEPLTLRLPMRVDLARGPLTPFSHSTVIGQSDREESKTSSPQYLRNTWSDPKIKLVLSSPGVLRRTTHGSLAARSDDGVVVLLHPCHRRRPPGARSKAYRPCTELSAASRRRSRVGAASAGVLARALAPCARGRIGVPGFALCCR